MAKSSVKYRKLTAAEHRALGLKPSAKRYVRASTKSVTKRTKTVSQRQAVQAKLGTTKEKYTKSRVETKALAKGGEAKLHKNLSFQSFMKILHANASRIVIPSYLVDESRWIRASGTTGDKSTWISGIRIRASDLVEHFDEELAKLHITKKEISKYAVRVYV